MKSNLRHLVLGTLCCTLFVPALRAAEPRNLEEALLNYEWSYHDTVKFNGQLTKMKMLHFERDGTIQVTVSNGKQQKNHWYWKPGGSLTAIVEYDHFPVTGGMPWKFDESFKSYSWTDGLGTKFGERKSALVDGGLKDAGATTQTDPNQPRIETLSQQALNAEEWVVAPLDESVPGGIRQNLVGLREDLADEGRKKPKVGIEAYSFGYQLCNAMIDALDERGRTLVKAGYTNAQANATTGVTSPALESNRNYMMSWPQYKREQAQRGELFRQKVNGAQVMREQTKVDWSNRAERIKRNIDRLYGQFREAMR